MSGHLLGMFDTHKIAGQTNVVKVKLGRLDQALLKIGVKGLELEDDVACLQDRKPLSGRGV